MTSDTLFEKVHGFKVADCPHVLVLAGVCPDCGRTGLWGLYARVSKAEDQTNANQVLQLKSWGTTQPFPCKVFEETISSRKTRPVKEEVLRMLRTGELAGVAFVSLSRWGRSTTELVGELR